MLKPICVLFAVFTLAACSGKDNSPMERSSSDEAIRDTNSPIAFDSAMAQQLDVVAWINARLSTGEVITYANAIDEAAATFVQLALHMGRFDADYVDAYHGPEMWRTASAELTPDYENLASGIAPLQAQLEQLDGLNDLEAIRVSLLKKLSRAMAVRLQVIRGEDISFDQEVTDIYDEQTPVYELSVYDAVLTQIDALLPGEGSLADRVDAFRNSLAIPKDKLQVVFDRAIAECRARTTAFFDLPENESFRMEFVTDKPWSGYNYYQGGFESLIQINTDFPIVIDRAVDLGCHEGYPGHHVWNLFIEQELVGQRGWIEYTVNPLFGPFGPIAEGSANYGIELAFPGDQKIAFERDVLFPLAGLDPQKAEQLDKLNALTGQLSHATNEIARRYLDGDLTSAEAIPLIRKYYLASEEKSKQRLKFIDKYRAYVINYNIGKDRAAAWVATAGNDEEARWEAFRQILTQPMAPGDIISALE